MNTVSVLILTRNEEQNIKDCIKSCQPFADEVIVVDDGSEDNTVSIAEVLGAKVVNRSMNGDWGAQQTFAIEQASSHWIFFIDADERCSPELCKEIKLAIQGEDLAYWIQRHNRFHYNVATHGVLRPDYVCRLMPKEGSYVEGYVHPAIITPYDKKQLTAPMYHYTYDNWDQYFNKLNKYTTLSAEKYKKANKSVSFLKDIVFRPFWAFLKMYLLQGGILDGKMGWVLSVNHYFYTMTKYVKLYYLYKSNGKL